MKFGKNLIEVVAISNPEWGQYWINYKFLKKKIKGIVAANGGHKNESEANNQPRALSSSAEEVEFFKLLRKELKKTSDFFEKAQEEFRIRWERIWESYQMLHEKGVVHDKYTWTRLLSACVKFYKDVLLLENFAIMNYCGFSKILKKHDKCTGYTTRKAFMDKIMVNQNFTHYPYILDLIKRSEKLFQDIQMLESAMPLQDEERLFIDAIRGLNYQASRMQAEEKSDDSADEKRIEIITTGELRIRNNTHSPSPTSDQSAEEISEQLDAATSVLVDAARRLNSHSMGTSPDLKSALSWMQSIVKPVTVSREAESGTDEELPEDTKEDRDDTDSLGRPTKKVKMI